MWGICRGEGASQAAGGHVECPVRPLMIARCTAVGERSRLGAKIGPRRSGGVGCQREIPVLVTVVLVRCARCHVLRQEAQVAPPTPTLGAAGRGWWWRMAPRVGRGHGASGCARGPDGAALAPPGSQDGGGGCHGPSSGLARASGEGVCGGGEGLGRRERSSRPGGPCVRARSLQVDPIWRLPPESVQREVTGR